MCLGLSTKDAVAEGWRLGVHVDCVPAVRGEAVERIRLLHESPFVFLVVEWSCVRLDGVWFDWSLSMQGKVDCA